MIQLSHRCVSCNMSGDVTCTHGTDVSSLRRRLESGESFKATDRPLRFVSLGCAWIAASLPTKTLLVPRRVISPIPGPVYILASPPTSEPLSLSPLTVALPTAIGLESKSAITSISSPISKTLSVILLSSATGGVAPADHDPRLDAFYPSPTSNRRFTTIPGINPPSFKE